MPLSVKDGIKTWIDDFKKSDNPKFDGKSAEKRRDMAIAAYMSAKNESVQEAYDKPPFDPDPPKPVAKNSDQTKQSPMSRARQLAKKARDAQKDEGYVSHAQRKAVWANRADGGKGHPDKKNEEYTNDDYLAGKKTVKVKSGDRAGQTGYVTTRTNKNGKIHFTVNHDRTGYGNNSSMHPGSNLKVHKESVELDEVGRMSPKVGKASYTAPAKELKAYAQKSGGIDKKDFMQVADMLEKLDRINILQAGQLLGQLNAKLKNMDTSPREKVLSVLHKHGHNVGNVMPGTKMRRESVEQLDELSPATHKSYQAKAFRSGAAGMAAKRLGTMSTKDAYDNEKKRHAGIELSKSLQRRDARRKRNEETVSELKKSTLGSYVKKASQDAGAKAYSAAQKAMSNPDQSGKDYVKSVKRQKGIARATDRLAREGVNVDDAHRDAQNHSNGSMSVKNVQGKPSLIMKSYHSEKDGHTFAKKHGYKASNYVKTHAGSRMHIESVQLDEALNSNDYASLEKKHDELAAYHSKEAKKHHDASDNNSDDHAAARNQHKNAAKHHGYASMMARAAKDVTSDSTYPSHKVAAVKSDYDNSANRAQRNSDRAKNATTAANKPTNEAVNHDLYNSDTARKAHVGKVRARRQPDGSRLFYADVHNHVKAKAVGKKSYKAMSSGASLGYKSRKHAKDIADKMAHMMNTGTDNQRDPNDKLGNPRSYTIHTNHHKKYGNVKEAKSFDQKFRDHLKFSTSKSPAVQAYLKKRAADRDAMNKANDPNAAKKGYALTAVPPERAYKKARKKGMSAPDASQAVGTASRNRGRKLPK